MKTFPDFNEDGVVVAFEVSKFLLSLRKIAKTLRDVPGVDNVERRRFFEFSDELVRFRFYGQPYVVVEPFGDNSRFFVVSKVEGAKSIDIAPIEQAFKTASRFF
ncbi:MAG: hypothetical protein RQ826_17940 [Xanthomonadales bacterium]|nr:hypothetical protein [Xanthomonadales bacterium]